MRHRLILRFILVSLAILAPLLLAGCGSSSSGIGPAPTPGDVRSTETAPVAMLPTASPARPTPTSSSGQTLITPVPTPISLDVHAHAIPLVDTAFSGTGDAVLSVSARAQRALFYDTAGVAYIANTATGAGVTSFQSGGDTTFQPAVDAINVERGHWRAAIQSSINNSTYIDMMDLTTGTKIAHTLLSAFPGDGSNTLVTDPLGGGAFLATGYPNNSSDPPLIARLSSTGVTLHTAPLTNYYGAKDLYVDPHDHTIVAVEGIDLVGELGAVALEAFNANTLVRTWAITPDATPAEYALDTIHDTLWMAFTGGRVQIVSLATGHVESTIDPSYSVPAGWTQNADLVVDSARGVGYMSWSEGSDAGTPIAIDRIDATAQTRTLLTSYGGTLLAVLHSGRLLALGPDKSLLVLDQRIGAVIDNIVNAQALVGGPSVSNYTYTPNDPFSPGLTSGHDVDEYHNRVTVAFEATIASHNNVSGAATAGGLVTVTFRDPSS